MENTLFGQVMNNLTPYGKMSTFSRDCFLMDDMTGVNKPPIYEVDPASPAILLSPDWKQTSIVDKGDSAEVQMRKVRNVLLDDLIARYPYERVQKLAQSYRDWWGNNEDRGFLKLMDRASEIDDDFTLRASEVDTKVVNRCFREIEQHDLVVCKVIFHPSRLPEMYFGPDFMDLEHDVELAEICKQSVEGRVHRLIGHMYTANMIISTSCPVNQVYFSASPDCVGVMSYKDGEKYGEMGMALINSYAIKKLIVPHTVYNYSRKINKWKLK